MPRFQFVNPGASAVDELMKVLAERQTQRQQEFMNQLAQQREARDAKIQQAQLDSIDEQRKAGIEQKAVEDATHVTSMLKPGQNIDESTAGTLSKGKLGVLVKATPKFGEQSAAMPAGPVGDALAATGQHAVAPTMSVDRTFTGTPQQNADLEQKKKAQELAQKLSGVKDRQQAAQMVIAAGVPMAQVDDVLNAYMGKEAPKPTSAQEYEYAKANGYKGTYEQYQTEDANRRRPVTNIHNAGEGLDMSPDAMKRDVEDVLMGRNTLFNIRQTMGRSDKAAAYMQRMRSAVKDQDKEFDFVLSDAGGKATSSSFYQRGIGAINAVMPNLTKITELSGQVDRIGITGVDALLQRGAMYINDKKVTSLHQARKLLADEIGAALGAGSASDMKLQLGFDVTDPAVSDEVFAANIGLVQEFLENRRKGLNDLRYKSKTFNSGGGGADAAAPPAGPKLSATELLAKYGKKK